MRFNKKYFFKYKDMFNIYHLITKINAGYRLYFCELNKQFYIVNINNNFELCYSFKSFFSNILNDLRFYKIENINQIIKSIDENNEKLQQNNTNKTIENTLDLIKEKDYLIKRSKNNFI